MNKGFSLVEVMIVVSIIAGLAVIAVPRYNKYRDKSNRAECFSNGSTLLQNASAFLARNEVPPCDIDETINYTAPNQAACLGTIGFPVKGIAAGELSKLYYTYNVGAGGSASNNWFPNPGANKTGQVVAVDNSITSVDFPGVDFVITCEGYISTVTDTIDGINITSTGKALLRSDNMTGKSFSVADAKKF